MARLLRLDAHLVALGLAQSRQRAQELIAEGQVLVGGIVATKAATQVSDQTSVTLARADFPWVGRGALKLLGALDALPVAVEGKICADLGASTGGFTEVLLHRGATRVYAIDVGRGQLAWKLRQDPRVVCMEGTNVRHVDTLPDPIDLIVGDLSFIGWHLVLPTVKRLLVPDGHALLLVKPQFEVGPAAVSKGGKVRLESDRQRAIDAVRAQSEAAGFVVQGGADCTIPGARAGNVEHFLHLQHAPTP